MKEKTTMEFAGKRVLIIIENLTAPFDRRVWQEATALRDKGAKVMIICPVGKGYEKKYEKIDGIEIYRHKLPVEADSAIGYFLEYSWAIINEFYLTLKCFFKNGFDVIHACNPPDLIFFVALPFKLLGKKFVFDHHDINPELYIAKFKRKDFFYKMMVFFERLTFRTANVSIATNESYKEIALNRGRKREKDVFIVRSGPSFERLKIVEKNQDLKKGKNFLVGYVGVIGKQEGLNYLIDAAKYIVRVKGIENIHFICVGGGTELENIKKYARENGVYNYFTFTGRVSDKELLEALNTTDICVNPDEYNEMNDKSTMNKVMEYMALKKPIVQFDLKEGKFSARDASLYAKRNDSVDLAVKIIHLLANKELREKMGEYGYNRVKNQLEWKYERENLYKAYRTVFSL
ncbi:MAG: glycosyltransferase family 4 protein [Clostridiales bacterium]